VKPQLILDTDIGSDVDDAFALLIALGCPEFHLAAVTLVHAKLDVRARIAFKILKLAGRLDVPVAAGYSDTLTPGGRQYWAGHEGSETDFSDVADLKPSGDAVDVMLRIVRGNPGQVIITPVGPMTNIAAAIQRDPETMKLIRRMVIMGSVFKGTGPACAGAEHNAQVDPEATAIVLESGLPITLVGLNVTLQTIVTAEQIDDLRNISPLGDYTAHMASQFLDIVGARGTFMHDPLAVAIAAEPKIAQTRPLRPRALLRPNGECVVEFEQAKDGEPTVDVCVAIDAGWFERMFVSRIHNVLSGVG